MTYVDPTLLAIERDAHKLTVRSPFWSVTHDLNAGGAPVAIHFVHGAAGNILRRPITINVDGLTDACSPNARVRVVQDGNGVELVFSGSMADAQGKAANVSFRAVYHYSPYWIRRVVRLTLPSGTRARSLDVLDARFDGRFTHWSATHDPHTKAGRAQHVLGPHYDQDDGVVPEANSIFFDDVRPPGWMSLFKLSGEGVQITPTGDLSTWDAPAGVLGQGSFHLNRSRHGVNMQWRVLAASAAQELPRRLEFAAFISLVNLPATRRAPLRTVMVGNPPFPDDELLRAWADSGVELIVIMEGANWTSGTDRFWKVGDYPPYRDQCDNRDMNRMIHSAHAAGLRIIPYTCPTYLHPAVSGFAENVYEWHQAPVPDGQVIYHPAGKSPGGCYGALMCPDSEGWRDFYLHHVQTLLNNHDFDGVYLDNVWKAPCYNTTHGPSHHGGLDGLWEVMSTVRDTLGPERLMVVHNTQVLLVTPYNLADMIVTLEGYTGKGFRYDFNAIARQVCAFPACPVCLVPSSMWYRIPPPYPKQMGLRDGIAKGLPLGTLPYSYAMWETRWGYADNGDCLHDPCGLYAAFRQLKSLQLNGLNFDDCFTDVVHTNRKGVLGARYHGQGRQVVLISNVSGRDLKNIRWHCNGVKGNIGSLQADEYQFIEI